MRGAQDKPLQLASVQHTGRFQPNPLFSPFFFIAGDFCSKEHPMLASVHTLFMREHNDICDESMAQFPSYDDETLHRAARKIIVTQV